MNGWTKEKLVPRRPLAALVLLFAAPVWAADAPRVEVETLDEGAVSGQLVSLAAGRLVLRARDGDRDLPLARVLFVSPEQAPAAPSSAPSVWLRLLDGSALFGAEYLVTDNRIQFTPLGGGEAVLATAAVAHVRFQEQSPERARQWEQALAAEADDDLIVIRKNETIDHLSGRLGDVTADAVEFTLDGETTPVRRPRVEGLVYFHTAPPKLPDAVCRVVDASGGEWLAGELAFADGRLQLTTPAGVEAQLPWEQVARLDFSLGKVAYLSDLPTQSEEWTPYFGLAGDAARARKLFGPRRDQGLFGRPLALAGQTYAKGLAVHSRSQMVWRLPGKYGRLLAVAGLAQRAGRRGCVRLAIEADGRTLFDERIAAGDPPRALELDLGGARQLTVLVDYGDDSDVLDHLLLCDAKVVK